MKVTIEIDEKLLGDEIIIRCRTLSEEVNEIQKVVTSQVGGTFRLSLFKDDTQYYISPEEILFFETEGGGIYAHTTNDILKVKYRLYELEELLPRYFIRISKSSILNIKKVYSIEKNLTASSLVQFEHSHKQVYISRNYYKSLIHALDDYRSLKC